MFSIPNRRNWLKHLTPARGRRRDAAAPRKRPALRVETLEDRCVPTATASVSGVPNWLTQGPTSITGAFNVEIGVQASPDIGAVESIAVNPTNENQVFIATVNGGVWSTNDAFDAEPTWTALTDQQASLATSSIAFAPVNVDPTGSTVFVGTGSISSDLGSVAFGPGAGGAAVGLLRTTNDGLTFQQVGAALNGFRIRDVLPTSVQASGAPATAVGNEVVLAGTLDGHGLFRSTDGGITFGLTLGGTIDKLIPDPSDPTGNSFFAGVQGAGVFHSADNGATWVPVAGNGALGFAANDRIEIAASVAGGFDSLFVAVINTTGGPGFGNVRSFWHSDTGGAAFAQMDNPRSTDAGGLFPGGQGALHFSMVADPNFHDIVYVGGDRQPTSPDPTTGTTGFVGRHFVGDASMAVSGTPGSQSAATAQWTSMDGANAPAGVAGNATAPHADSRAMVVVPDPTFPFVTDILESDDGGIYRLFDAPGQFAIGGVLARGWDSANGNLSNSEIYSVAYDSLSHEIFAGAQDNGSFAQNNPGDTNYTEVKAGDGTVTAVDNSNPAFSIRYTSSQTLFLQSQKVDATGTVLSTTFPALKVGNTPLNIRQFDPGVLFVNPYVLDNVPNALTGKRMLIGTADNLYESANGGNTLTLPLPTNAPLGSVNGLDYGGVSGGVSNPFVILAGTTNGLFVRNGTTASGTVNEVFAGDVTSVQFDPNNWHTAYFTTTLAGPFSVVMVTGLNTPFPAFTPIGANLGTLTDTTSLDTLQVIDNGPSSEVLVGGFGGVFRAAPGGTWTMYGQNLPNVLVSQVVFNAKDNVLVVGTLGRAAFEVTNATASVFTPGVLNVVENHTDNVFLVRDAANKKLLDVFLSTGSFFSGTPDLQVPLATLSQIQDHSLGTGDTLTLDDTVDLQAETALGVSGSSVTGLFFSGNGVGRVQIPVNYSGVNLASLTVNGGSGGNTITVTGTSAAATTVNASFAFPANTVDVTGAATDLSGLAGKVTINAGFGADSITFDDSGRTSSDHITVNATSVSSNGAPSGITYNFFSHVTVDTPAVGNSLVTVHSTPAFVPTDIFLGGFSNHVTVNVTSSSGYLLHLHSAFFFAGNTLQALNVTGPVVVKHPAAFEFDFLYALQFPFFTSKIFWDSGFSSATSSPAPT